MYTKKYYDFIRISKDRYEARLELVEAALEYGIKPTARKYRTTVKTVRKGVRRYEADKKAWLVEQSRRPHTSPRATKMWMRCKLNKWLLKCSQKCSQNHWNYMLYTPYIT